MKDTRMMARDLLKKASLTEYNHLIEEARLSRRQKYILYQKFSEGLKNFQIAMKLELSPETIRDDLRDAFDRVWLITH